MGKKAVIAVINYDGLILIGKKRSKSPKVLAGEWHVLGEGVEKGESDKSALERCAREEAGIVELRVGKYIGSHKTPTSGRTARWYECFAYNDHVKAGSDLEEVKWVPKQAVLNICRSRVSSWPKAVQNYFGR